LGGLQSAAWFFQAPWAPIHLSSKEFDLHHHFSFFRNPPTVPRIRVVVGADQPFGSARLGSEKGFLRIRRERVHLCKLSNLRFSSAYLVTLAHVANRPQVVRKEQRRASTAPRGHHPLQTPPEECNKKTEEQINMIKGNSKTEANYRAVNLDSSSSLKDFSIYMDTETDN
jgi:hypothetical protein